MDVILLERVAKLGQIGDVVKVRPGYARNFLLPNKKAVRATEENRKRFEEQRADLEAANLDKREQAETLAARLDGFKVVLIRQAGDSGQLYGSVTARDIAEAVAAEAGMSVRRQQVELSLPIKSIGVHSVAVRLHPEVAVVIAVNVARSSEEAEAQAPAAEAAGGGIEAALEAQAKELFEAEAVEHAIEEIRAEQAYDEATQAAGRSPDAASSRKKGGAGHESPS